MAFEGEEVNPRLIHLVNSSWTNTQRNITWAQKLQEAALPVVERGVKDVMIRYPFGHPSVTADGKPQDYYWTGYWEAQRVTDDDLQPILSDAWSTFTWQLTDFARDHGVTFWIYAGYMGGGAKPTDPNLLARENDPNAWRWLVDLCLTPLEKINPRVIYFDAMGGAAESNVYARWILALNAQHELAGVTRIGIEHPNLEKCPHWYYMPTASTWPNFESALRLGYFDRYFTDPRCVLVNTGGPDHAEQVRRVKVALEHGAYAVCPFGDWTQAELESL